MPTGIYTRPSLLDRMMKSYTVNDKTGCWDWKLSLNKFGYGQVRLRHPERRMGRAHRVMYELLKGNIEEGLHLDHLCRNRKCINPDHLEPVTGRTNYLRGMSIPAQNHKKTHCLRNHPLSGYNLMVFGKRRTCRECCVQRNKEWKLRVKQANVYQK
jgi:hypothetical protein